MLLHKQYDAKKRILVFYDDERVVKLLSIMDISVELVSSRISFYSLQEKIQRLLESYEPGGIKVQKTHELSPAESNVIFNLLRGDSLLHIAEKCSTHRKAIFSQKYSEMRKLQLSSMSTIFVAGKQPLRSV